MSEPKPATREDLIVAVIVLAGWATFVALAVDAANWPRAKSTSDAVQRIESKCTGEQQK